MPSAAATLGMPVFCDAPLEWSPGQPMWFAGGPLKNPASGTPTGTLGGLLLKYHTSFDRYFQVPPAERQAQMRADFEALLLCRASDGAILGFFNLSQIVRRGFQSAYLGYAVGKPYAGQGYMRDGLELVLRHAFTTMRLHRVEANIQPTNTSSLALARGAGFRREGFSPRYLKISGRWRDHERWAILAEEWRDRTRTLAGSDGFV